MNSDTVLPTLRVRAPVQIATTCEDCDRFLSPLLEATARHTPEAPLVYSLDTEWVNQDTVALVQLALPQCAGGNVVLVRLCVLRDAASITGVPVKFPTSLAAVLSNDALVAVGVGVKNDLKLLREQWPYAHTSTTSIGGNFCLVSTELTSSADQIYKTEAASKILLNGLCGGRCLDLSLLESRQNQGAARPQGKQLGLSALVARLLGHTLIKDTALRCGDWGAENLSISQVEYAALDASAGLSLFHTLAASASGSENASKSAFEGFDATDAFWKSVESVLSRAWLPGDETNPNRRRGRKTGSKDKSISDTSASITSKKSYFVPKTRSHYDGCRLHAPNGTHLANINARRAEWYVRQGLGKLLCSPPHDDHACAIQLNFTPKGGPKTKATGDNDDGDDHNDGSDDVYQRAHRPNCCVGCGAGSIVMADNLKPPRMRVGNGGRLNGSTGLADPVNNGSSNSSISSSYSSNSSTSTSGSNSSGSNSSNSNSNSNDDVAINSFGGSDGLNRFSIVPQCFRRLLPVAVKSRSSHDIVLLCHPCRDKAQAAALRRRASLLDAHNLVHHPPPPRIDLQRKTVRSAANALAAHNVAKLHEIAAESASRENNTGEVPPPLETAVPKAPKKVKSKVIPPARVAELLEVVRSFLELDDVASVGPSEIEHCRAVDLSLRAPIVISSATSAVAVSADAPSPATTLVPSLKKRSRNSSNEQRIEEPSQGDADEEEEQEAVGTVSNNGTAVVTQAEAPEAILLERLGLYKCASSNCGIGKSDDSSAGTVDGVSNSKDGFDAQRSAVQAFVEEWRNLFLEAVQPKLLPEGWRVERPVWSE